MKWFLVGSLFFSFFSSPAHAQSGIHFDSNLDSDLVTQVKQDLQFLSRVDLSAQSSLHVDVFGRYQGNRYLLWFQERVNSMGKCLCGDDAAVACVLSAWENKIWVTPNYTRFNHPAIARLSVLIHESRHTEANDHFWPHTTCPTPFKDGRGQDEKSIWTGALLQGMLACDVMATGSYGTQVIFLKNISHYCKNCTDKVKADAKLYGDNQLERIIDPKTAAMMKKDLN